MPMKVKSEQINTEFYTYTLVADENIFFPVKSRPEEVIIVTNVCLYNPSQSDYSLAYKLMRQRGQVIRLRYAATLKAGVVERFPTCVYLRDGEECGIAITPNAAGDVIEVSFQIIRLRDDEYDIPT